jgi:hypothetical protein
MTRYLVDRPFSVASSKRDQRDKAAQPRVWRRKRTGSFVEEAHEKDEYFTAEEMSWELITGKAGAHK